MSTVLVRPAGLGRGSLDVGTFVGEIVEKAQSARGLVDLRRQVIASLEARCPSDLVYWGMPAGNDTTALYMDVRDARDRALAVDRFLRDPQRFYSARFIQRLIESDRVALDSEIMSRRELDRQPFHVEILRPIGIGSLLNYVVRFRGAVLSGVTLGRRGASFSARERDWLRRIGPALGLVEAAFVAPARPAGTGRAARDFGLSAREAEVAALIARGLQNKEIAAVFGTSPETVRKQAIRVYAKTGASGRSRLAALLSGSAAAGGVRS